jgi:general secretion pathway protein J
MTRPPRGFTLLEIQLAILLLAGLLVLVGTAMTGAQRSMARSEALGARLTELRAVQTFLRRQLQQAVPLPLGPGVDASARVFMGEPQEMRFVASLPVQLGGGLHLQVLRQGGAGGDRWLEIDFARIVDDGAIVPWGSPQRLLRDAGQLRLAYDGLDERGRATGWLPRWPWPQRLPQRVRVDLDAGAPVAWPALLIALRLDLGGGAPGGRP